LLDRGIIGGSTATITIEWTSTQISPPVDTYMIYIDDGLGTFGAPIVHSDLVTLQHQFTGLNDAGTYNGNI
jgi:hypothetical protein